MKKKLQDSTYKIESLLSAVEAVAEKMPSYDAYPIKALCAWGQDEITNLQNIIERIPDEKQ